MRLPLLLLSVCLLAAQTSYRIDTVAGAAAAREGAQATAIRLASVDGLAIDAQGRLYIADAVDHRVRRVNRDGTIVTVAGNGIAAYSGDGGPATQASLNAPYGVALDVAGNLFIADFGNARVRRLGLDGVIRTVAPGAQFAGPRNLVVSSAGDLYVSDHHGHRVWRVSPSGAATAIAGTGSPGDAAAGPATRTPLRAPAGIAVDGQGAVYVADSGNRRIVRIASELLSTVALEGAAFGAPMGLGADAFGGLYVADAQTNLVLHRSSSGAVTIIAGAEPALAGPLRELAVTPTGLPYLADGTRVLRVLPGTAPETVAGGGPEDSRKLASPIGVALDAAGNLYIAEEAARRIRRLSSTGELVIVAEGGLITDPVAVAFHPFAGLRIADYQGNRILGLNSSGDAYVVSGDGTAGDSGDGGPAHLARWRRPRGLAFDRAGNLYVADSLNHRVRRIGVGGVVTTIAGTGVAGFSGDGGLARRAQLNTPSAVAVDGQDNVYVADSANNAIRAISVAGFIASPVGPDGGLRFPTGVAAGTLGNLIVADTFQHRLKLVDPDGRVTVIAGDGQPGLAGDGGPAASALLRSPASVAVDERGVIYFADLDNQRIRRLTPVTEPVTPAAPNEANPAGMVVLNAASLLPGPLAPGQILALNVVAGEVRIDGLPAPVIASRTGRTDVQAPYALAPGTQVTVEARAAGAVVGTATVSVVETAPGLYTTPEGTAAPPAPRGSIASFYLTGAGRLSPLPRDGDLARAPLAEPVHPIRVRIGPGEAEVVWSGAAPGQAGVVQVNVRLPGLFARPGTLPVVVTVGGVATQTGVNIEVR